MIYIFGGAFDPPHVGHMAIVQSILVRKNPEKIVIIPSSERDDKKYHVSDEHRLAMLRIFVDEINKSLVPVTLTDEESALKENSRKREQIYRTSEGQSQEKIILDDHFIRHWKGEMITRDVDEYAREKFGDDIIHIFGTDTIESMPSWDSEGYAAKKVKKLFVPREYQESRIKNQQGSSFYKDDKNDDCIAVCLRMIEQAGIENFEIFQAIHIPDISSTALRENIPSYTSLKMLYEDNPKFIIPGLSRRISQYILQNRLYRNQSSPKPKILVHVCCGPDVTMPILALRDEYDVVCFWYDPNIQPKKEHDKRYEAFKKICEIEDIPFIKGAYDVKNFFTRIRGLESTPEKGEKCTHCYDMRMYVAAKLAKRLSIPYYTSSLNTSPKKDLEKLFKIGHEYAARFDIMFLDVPFRKRGGFEQSVDYTRKHDIYRQNYCGCVYSIREGGESGMKGKRVS